MVLLDLKLTNQYSSLCLQPCGKSCGKSYKKKFLFFGLTNNIAFFFKYCKNLWLQFLTIILKNPLIILPVVN